MSDAPEEIYLYGDEVNPYDRMWCDWVPTAPKRKYVTKYIRADLHDPEQFNIAYAKQAERIAELEAAQQWISVEDRLPDEYASVLGVTVDSDGEPFYGESFVTDEGSWSDVFDTDDFKAVNITHWIPLPALPQEDSDG